MRCARSLLEIRLVSLSVLWSDSCRKYQFGAKATQTLSERQHTRRQACVDKTELQTTTKTRLLFDTAREGVGNPIFEVSFFTKSSTPPFNSSQLRLSLAIVSTANHMVEASG